MGQYYRIAFKHEGGRVKVNDRKIDGGGYILAKLTEHSWLGCILADAVAHEMHGNPMRLAWIGDYADEGTEVADATGGAVTYEKAWKHDHRHSFAKPEPFVYEGKFLVNHSKKMVMSFDGYINAAKTEYGILFPVSLLTAIGNDRGGGDYRDNHPDYDKVGTWAWDLLSIEDSRPEGDGWQPFMACFRD